MPAAAIHVYGYMAAASWFDVGWSAKQPSCVEAFGMVNYIDEYHNSNFH
jgi:hypothetical protein